MEVKSTMVPLLKTSKHILIKPFKGGDWHLTASLKAYFATEIFRPACVVTEVERVHERTSPMSCSV